MSFDLDVPFPSEADVRPLRPMPAMPGHWTSLASAIVFTARKQYSKRFATGYLSNSDALESKGMELTYGQLLQHSTALASVLERELSRAPNVGVLLPPCIPSAVANAALIMLGRVVVDLNLLSNDLVNEQITSAEIEFIITSRRFLQERKLQPKGNIIFVEDLKSRVRLPDKIWSVLMSKLPMPLLPLMGRWFKGLIRRLEDTAIMLFTSGSTGVPKAVKLSHRAMLFNIRQIEEHVGLQPDDRVMGCLPFYHSFGKNVTFLAVACLGLEAVYYVSPLHAATVGHLVQKHRCTILALPPSLLHLYMENCQPVHFESVRLFVVGSEELMPETANAMERVLGQRVLNAYGTSEMSPFIAANVPHDVITPDGRVVPGNKLGTVGQVAPGTGVFIADLDTGGQMPTGEDGVIFVHGPQAMTGYFKRSEATRAVLRDRWYLTGDVGFLDSDGFLTITDRLDRIKMSGEMVPLPCIKSAILRAAPGSELMVVGVQDKVRGERPVVLYTHLSLTPEEVLVLLSNPHNQAPCATNRAAQVNENTSSGLNALPKLWIPKRKDFYCMKEWPITGTGKKDRNFIKKIAAELAGDS